VANSQESLQSVALPHSPSNVNSSSLTRQGLHARTYLNFLPSKEAMKTTAISTPKRFIFAQLHAQLNEDGLRSFYGRVTLLSSVRVLCTAHDVT